jgi:hypothetical protein
MGSHRGAHSRHDPEVAVTVELYVERGKRKAEAFKAKGLVPRGEATRSASRRQGQE